MYVLSSQWPMKSNSSTTYLDESNKKERIKKVEIRTSCSPISTIRISRLSDDQVCMNGILKGLSTANNSSDSSSR